MSRSFAFLPLLVLCASVGCDSSSPSQPDGNIPFETLVESKVSGSAGPQIQTVVRTEADWFRVWSELWGGREIASPPVDFSRDMVVLATASQTCFGGAEIEAIEHTGDDLLIRYGDAGPSLCLCVQPELAFQAVVAPRVLGDAHFAARQTPALCP